MPTEYLDAVEAAKYLGCSRQYIANIVRREEIAVYEAGGLSYFNITDLKNFHKIFKKREIADQYKSIRSVSPISDTLDDFIGKHWDESDSQKAYEARFKHHLKRM